MTPITYNGFKASGINYDKTETARLGFDRCMQEVPTGIAPIILIVEIVNLHVWVCLATNSPDKTNLILTQAQNGGKSFNLVNGTREDLSILLPLGLGVISHKNGTAELGVSPVGTVAPKVLQFEWRRKNNSAVVPYSDAIRNGARIKLSNGQLNLDFDQEHAALTDPGLKALVGGILRQKRRP